MLVIRETEAEEVMVPLLLPEPVAAAALKVVEEKPQERTTSSTSGGSHVVSDGFIEGELFRGDIPFWSLSSSSSLSVSNWRMQAAHSGSWVLAPLVLQMQSTSWRSPSKF